MKIKCFIAGLLFFLVSIVSMSFAANGEKKLVDQTVLKDVAKLAKGVTPAADSGGSCQTWTITSCPNQPSKSCSNPDPNLNAVTCQITNCTECTPLGD